MDKKVRYVWVLVTQSCLTLCDPVDYTLLGSSLHGILQARMMQWVYIPFSRESSWSRDWTQVSCTADRFLSTWATKEAQYIVEYYSAIKKENMPFAIMLMDLEAFMLSEPWDIMKRKINPVWLQLYEFKKQIKNQVHSYREQIDGYQRQEMVEVGDWNGWRWSKCTKFQSSNKPWGYKINSIVTIVNNIMLYTCC